MKISPRCSVGRRRHVVQRVTPYSAEAPFAIWDGLVPANQVMHTYRTRLRITQKRGQQTQALAATVNILDQAGDVLLRIGRIDAADASWTFMLFLNATTTAVMACTGVAWAKPTTNPASSRCGIDPE
ncbi:hypothetical protein [Streptomyces sp. NPDC056937]|uniref:hypothetical protein n=1 Tax=Streptomyces sp. NPDC056937 TaxID=3345969 RepID=UPI00363E2D66